MGEHRSWPATSEAFVANPRSNEEAVRQVRRHVNAEETLEVLCVKAGEGSFGYDGQMLMGKETKKLPSSD